MRYFKVDFEYHTRPLYHKGRIKVESVTFAAGNMTDAYKLAQEEGVKRYPRHRWKVVRCVDLTPTTV